MPRTAIVTGGTKGIGLAACKELTGLGYRVAALWAHDESAAEACRKGLDVMSVRCDVGDFDACGAAVKAVEAELGPVDVLVNDAGVTRDATLRKMTREQWGEVIRVDLDSQFNMCRQVVDGMCARGFGRIINITSINGQKGQFGQTNYSAAKAGELGFTKALALETARLGITANSICPGYIHTEMLDAVPPEIMEKSILPQIPVGRLGKPEEIARAVVFLAAEEAGFITGSTLSINGGQYMS
jgi:acetoacetyl-CoA reductase